MTRLHRVIVVLLAVAMDTAHSAGAVVILTQETPCLPTQSCRLKCSVVSGNNVNGLSILRNNSLVVSCLGGRDSCSSDFPHLYSDTQVGYSTSYVNIRSFDASVDATTWSCVDGVAGTPSSLQVIVNLPPTGPLTFGNSCVNNRSVSPALLNCSLPQEGRPPANLKITNSNHASAGNGIGNVTGTVTSGGQASCSVTWPAFPSYPLNISPVLCDVQVAASVTISVRDITGQGKVITCQAEGHPDTYTFQPWLQSWEGQEVRHVNGSQQGGQYSLTLTSYQDSGTYSCSVDNGVLDSSGQVIRRTANISVSVEVKDGLYPGSTLAAAVVVAAVLAAAVAVATTCVAMRLRSNSGPKERNASAEYQNVAYRGQTTQANLGPSPGRTQTDADRTLPKEVGAYNVLDPVSRDLPRVPLLYQGLTQSGFRGDLESRGNQGNQTYTNVATEGHYDMPSDGTD